MVIQIVHIGRIATFETKNDAPIGADGDTPEPGQFAFQRMKTPARQIHMRRLGTPVQAGRHAPDFLQLLRIQSALIIIVEKPLQAAMTKPPDPAPCVNRQLSLVYSEPPRIRRTGRKWGEEKNFA